MATIVNAGSGLTILDEVVTLAKITESSATNYTLSDSLSNYKYVELVITPAYNNTQVLASTFLHVELFKYHSMQADYRGEYNVYCQYIDDLDVRGAVLSNGQIAYLYGIK